MALDDDRLHGLIQACYDAALDPTRWPGILQRLRDTVGAAECRRLVRHVGLDDFGQAALPNPADAVVPSTVRGGGASDATGRRLADHLLPHLDRCRQIRVQLATAACRAARLAAALDRVPVAVLMLDAGGRVVHVNAAGDRLLRAGDALAVRGGRIAAASRPETDRLDLLIAAAAHAGCAARPGAMMTLSRPPPGLPRSLTVAPLPPGARRDRRAAAVLLLVRDPAAVPPVAGARLVELYGLTGAEARVATALLAGDSLREVASQLCVGLATVRSHLHRLFDKTGARRQAELVGLLTTLALL